MEYFFFIWALLFSCYIAFSIYDIKLVTGVSEKLVIYKFLYLVWTRYLLGLSVLLQQSNTHCLLKELHSHLLSPSKYYILSWTVEMPTQVPVPFSAWSICDPFVIGKDFSEVCGHWTYFLFFFSYFTWIIRRCSRGPSGLSPWLTRKSTCLYWNIVKPLKTVLNLIKIQYLEKVDIYQCLDMALAKAWIWFSCIEIRQMSFRADLIWKC